jgi:hypothetical protein
VFASGVQVNGASEPAVTPAHSVVLDGKDPNGNAKVELRGGTPYLDFSFNDTNDWDAKIELAPPGQLYVMLPTNGELDVMQPSGVIGANIQASGKINANGEVTARGVQANGAGGPDVTQLNTVVLDGNDPYGNAKVELRGGNPYLDFSTNNTNDFDFRLAEYSGQMTLWNSARQEVTTIDSSGDIHTNGTASFVQPGSGGERLRTIRGTVILNPYSWHGGGYSLSAPSGTINDYVLTFSTPFSDWPSCMIQPADTTVTTYVKYYGSSSIEFTFSVGPGQFQFICTGPE